MHYFRMSYFFRLYFPAFLFFVSFIYGNTVFGSSLLPEISTHSTIFSPTICPSTSTTTLSSTDTQRLFELAFKKAFSDGQALSDTRLFEKLGYTSDQIKAMVEITPRPASVRVECIPDPQVVGRYSLLRIHASQIHYYKLVIDHGTLDFPGALIDLPALNEGRLVFQNLDNVDIETFVSSDDFLKVFQFFASAKKLSDLKMKISPKETSLSGKVKKGFLTVVFKVFGLPALDGPKKVRFNCKRLVLNGVSLPRAAVHALFNSINPVFDANRTWLDLELKAVANEEGFIRSSIRLLKRLSIPPSSMSGPIPAPLPAPPLHPSPSILK
ncbi:MAG: hypothetical protein WA705_24230 [Candidatus Ozemobacteraceae bacterium]